MNTEKINLLRQEMIKEGIHAYLVPTNDFHGSEYVCEAFKAREYLSGFTGSAGTLVVTMEEAGLWTDGRYFIQAERELKGSGIRLFRMQTEGVPTIKEYLQQEMKSGQTLAFDGRCISAKMGEQYERELQKQNVAIKYDQDLIGRIWTNRPDLPCQSIWSLPLEWSGKSCLDKVEEVRSVLKEEDAEALLLTKLDDLMWLFNIRGGDIPCNPVALSYGYIDQEQALLFVQEKALTEACRNDLLKEQVTICEYEKIYRWLQNLKDKKVLIDSDKCNYSLYKLIERKNLPVIKENPTESLKAVKNPVELKQIRECYRQDSAAVIRFIKWIKEKTKENPLTEIQAAAYLDGLRAKIPGFLELSFETICAYGENAAMMHYGAKEEQCSAIEPEGLLLVDSGGQYWGGTTDVTRTIVLGEICTEIKKQYTAVVKGMLSLSQAVFLHGCTGRNLDILAREPLWQMKIDYKCGTGHGIGYMLNVHEGPQNIRWSYNKDIAETVLVPGMLLSNEPGVYKEGSHGIRIENILAVKDVSKNADGQFLGFETLTWVPIDTDGIEVAEMNAGELEQLNEYHRKLYEVMKDYLNEEEQEWLSDATKPIG